MTAILSQRSLEICTESLGSETGSEFEFLPWPTIEEEEMNTDQSNDQKRQEQEQEQEQEEIVVGRRKETPPRSFPPPLTSLTRSDGQCLSMRTRRHGGRLVVEAVSAPSQSYFLAQRCHGRLLLSFINKREDDQTTPEEEEDEQEEEEEEVQVLDRGIVVEVKVQRSSVVINKFVGVASEEREMVSGSGGGAKATATAVVAAAASCSGSADERWRRCHSPETLFFTSKKMMNRQELLHHMRRCSEHRRPLFIWEPSCSVTT
ncbi:uncharacterized protein LOC144708770 [Wolffia australiana]